jgi:hypothetical protein
VTKIDKSPESILSNIEVGDKVHVVTKEGDDIDFYVLALRDTSIVGESVEVQNHEIAKIEKKEISVVKTTIVGMYSYILASFLITIGTLIASL